MNSSGGCGARTLAFKPSVIIESSAFTGVWIIMPLCWWAPCQLLFHTPANKIWVGKAKIQITDSAYPLIILIDGFKKKRWFFTLWQPRAHQVSDHLCLSKTPHAAQAKHTQTLSILRQSTEAFLWNAACHIAQTLSPFKRALEVLSVSTDYTCCHAIRAFHQEVKCKTAAIKIFKNLFWAEAVLTKRRNHCEPGKCMRFMRTCSTMTQH